MASNYTDVITKNQIELSFTPPQNYFLTCERLPKIVFTVQEFTIPTLSGGEAVMPNMMNPSRSYIPGDGIDYGTLDLTYLIDKAFAGYRELLLWMKGINAPDDTAQSATYKDLIKTSAPDFAKTMSHIELFGTDAGNRPIVSWKFKNAFPISLGGPNYNAASLDIEPLIGSIAFRYMYFECETFTNGIANNNSI